MAFKDLPDLTALRVQQLPMARRVRPERKGLSGQQVPPVLKDLEGVTGPTGLSAQQALKVSVDRKAVKGLKAFRGLPEPKGFRGLRASRAPRASMGRPALSALPG